ncbi:replication endonuclease [Marinomonas sp. PE14-40]|uniref:replication endonuclease n=1 Tax=Marinomonas sp. PE14-40 TaxID=3060621 RepID=UPI003F660D1C
MHKPTEQCIEWRNDLLSNVSNEDDTFLRIKLVELDQSEGYVKANSWLRGVIERYELLAKVSVLRPLVGKEATRLAKYEGQAAALDWMRGVVERLQFCDKMITELDGQELSQWAWQKSNDFEVKLYAIGTQHNPQAVKDFIKLELMNIGQTFGDWKDNDKVVGLAARMITTEWWIRQAKRQWVVVEQILRECGQVNRFASPYLSDWALRKEEQKQENNKAFLEGWEATNDKGQTYTLAQLSDLGISNPDHRFAELIVRIKGLEEVAEEQGHEGWFITLTCPSKFHAYSGSRRNNKWWKEGCPTIQDAHNHLNHVWGLFRAWCNNHGIQFYGLRTVEPHHDGAPHWHLMLFLKPEDSKAFLAKFEAYALQVDGKERGAKKHRFVTRKIDREIGSATGYIVKYISKNVHGKNIDTDHETGRSGTDAAKRIVGWARLNRIRQFQFIGGASVTVWRELRRLGMDAAPKAFADIYHAANRADFSGFVKLMGGVFAGKDQTLKTYYSEPEENQYGELVKSVKGVANGIEVVITRIYEWTIQRKGAGSKEDGEAAPPWTRVNNCTPAHLLEEIPIESYQDERGGANVF